MATFRYTTADIPFEGVALYSKTTELPRGLIIETDRGILQLADTDEADIIFRPNSHARVDQVIRRCGKPPYPQEMSVFQRQIEDFVDACQQGRPPMVDGRQGLTSLRLLEELFDVSNLARAIELALDLGAASGKRMFVTDDEDTTWRDVIEGLTPVAELTEPVPAITREELSRLRMADSKPSISVAQSLKHLISSDVRAAMRKDPLWAKVEQALPRGVTRLGKGVEGQVRLSIAGPLPIPKVNSGPQYNVQLCLQQLRGVRHASDLAKQELGYKPLYTFAASMRAFCAWYRSQHGMDTGSWDPLKQIY
jgi:hypothetical protein